uniref:Lipase n=1 Tax=Rhodnius prolixus TaxID=13249 RepID=T1H895_RHOPR
MVFFFLFFKKQIYKMLCDCSIFKINLIYVHTAINLKNISNGFGYQSYRVITKDGYILQIHRIISKKSGPPILLQHGFSLASDIFVMCNRKSSLAFQLADAGFDVWLSDQRGNWYSKKHLKYTTNDAQFWDFSFHESGFYDLPAIIDKILDATGHSKITYIGYSLGTTIFLVMASTRPEYNQKVKEAILLGPTAMLSRIYGYSLEKIFYSLRTIYVKLFQMKGHYEFLPRTVNIIKWIKHLCRPSLLQKYCLDFLVMINREHLENINKQLISDQLSYFPAGTSVKNAHHLMQLFINGFRQYDYGESGNRNMYKKSIPPLYPLHNITTPIAIYWAKNDVFIEHKNIEDLVKKLPNISKSYLVPDPNFSHIDFIIGINTSKLVNENIITYLRENN